MLKKQTFTKKERLCSKKLTQKLFKKSHSFFDFPFKIVYFFNDSSDINTEVYPVQVLFTASKRILKKAVSRNMAKRIMKESYRKNKTPLYEKLIESKKKLILGFVYNGHEVPEYRKTEQKIILIINRLIHKIDKEDKKSLNPPNIHHNNNNELKMN